MDTTYLPDWNTDVEGQVPVPNQRRRLGLENELVELLWQDGEVVLRSQIRQKASPVVGNLMTNSIQDDEPISWIHCPIDEAFEKEFYPNFSSKNQLSSTAQANSIESEKSFKISVSDDVNHVHQISQQPTFASPARFETFESAHQDQSSGFVRKTVGSSLCGSNQIASSCGIGRTLSAGLNENHTRNISPQSNNRERETHDQAILSSYGGSGRSLCKTSNQSNDNNCHKRKSRNVKESECPTDATEFESASGHKSSQKSGTTRRSNVAEVHNLSERRRRDRINEKMRALQELIPHSNKSDKASMLDEAIEYMKSLQSQIQLLWMGSGMAPMVLPGMQQFMPRIGMGIGPMHLSRMPLVDQAMAMNQATVGLRPVLNPMNYQNQVQNPGFAEQYANYMALCSMRNTSQPMNMFGFGSHSSQQNHVAAPPGNGKGSVP